MLDMPAARILSLIFVMFLLSCGQDDFMSPDPGSETGTDMMIDPPISEEINATVSGIVTDELNQPIPYATITTKGRQQYTDELGHFSISSEKMPLSGLYIKVAKDGYINGYTFLKPSDSAIAYTKIQLVQPLITSLFSSDEGIDLQTPDGSALRISPNTMADGQGNPYTGEVNVNLKPYLTSDPALTLQVPGDLRGKDTEMNLVQLATYGMMSVELTSPEGEELNIRAGETADLIFPISADQSLSAPEEIPLWYFDEASGYWVEEGLATKQGEAYVAQVSHFSFWNCDAPFPLIDIVGRLVDAAGLPIIRKSIKIEVTDSGIVGYGQTDSQGFYRGKVPSGEMMVLSIVDNCTQLDQLNIGPFDSDTDLGDLYIDRGPSGFVSGRLIDCATMSPVSGYAYVFNENDSYFFTTDNQGYYSGHVHVCDNNDFQVIGYDPLNAGAADPVDFSLEVGQELELTDILICENTTTFFNLQSSPSGGPSGDPNILQLGQGFTYRNGALSIELHKDSGPQFSTSLNMEIYQPKPGDNVGKLAHSRQSGGPFEFTDCELDSDCMSITITEFDLREGGSIGGRYYLELEFGGVTGEFRCQIIEFEPDAPLECVDIVPTNINGSSSGFCVGDASISIVPKVTGGVAPFEYEWADGTIGTNQTSGEKLYTVEVTDFIGNSCSVTLDYKFSPVLEFESSSVPTSCDEADGSATIAILNYADDFSITWEDGTVGPTLNNVAAGYYEATVIYNDSNCSRSIYINVPNC